jgi:hypothetical protein
MSMSIQQEAARTKLENLLNNLRLHLDAYPGANGEEFDWEQWGKQWCQKEVSE